MKINELIQDFNIYLSNEEKTLLDKIKQPCYIEVFSERERVVIENLVRKSLVSKINFKGTILVKPNEKS